MKTIVEAQNLSRFYGIILGLNNVSFSIRPGITGVVGPNGAGKTTLFRLLTGQIKPSSGTLSVFGEKPWSNPAVQARLGYCPENEDVPAGIRPVTWLTSLGMISGLSSREARARATRMLEQVKLEPRHWKKPVSQFSKGMRQRVKLAQCLLHEPKLIILDEPMNGLDPMGREDFAVILRGLAADGVSVVVSSHILPDLEALCREFILLRWGRIPRTSLQEPLATAATDAGKSGAPPPLPRPTWPASTTFCCESPRRLARFLFDHDLVRGCEIDEEARTLQVRWVDPAQFYEGGRFHQLLLESGVPIQEVRATRSKLEQHVAAPGANAS